MNIVRFSAANKVSYGILNSDKIWKLENSIYDNEYVYGDQYDINEVVLKSPVTPGKIIGIGLNYKSVAQSKGVEFPEEPVIFLKPPSSIIGSGEDIIIPKTVQKPTFEAEIGVVIS